MGSAIFEIPLNEVGRGVLWINSTESICVLALFEKNCVFSKVLSNFLSIFFLSKKHMFQIFKVIGYVVSNSITDRSRKRQETPFTRNFHFSNKASVYRHGCGSIQKYTRSAHRIWCSRLQTHNESPTETNEVAHGKSNSNWIGPMATEMHTRQLELNRTHTTLHARIQSASK